MYSILAVLLKVCLLKIPDHRSLELFCHHAYFLLCFPSSHSLGLISLTVGVNNNPAPPSVLLCSLNLSLPSHFRPSTYSLDAENPGILSTLRLF